MSISDRLDQIDPVTRVRDPLVCTDDLHRELASEIGQLRLERAEFADEVQSLRNRIARMPDNAAAVRAVLDLHKPYPDEGMGWREDHTYGDVGTVCGSCGTPDEYGVPWPCPTVRAIANALGEEA